MRSRLFKLIFFSILITVLLIDTLSYLFLKKETEIIIDEHIEKLAASLISSDLSEESLSQFEITDEEMQDILGGPRINHIVAIYDHSGKRLYANYTAETIGVTFDNVMAWQNKELAGHHIRYLVISTRGLIVQVGLVMDEFRHRWVALSYRLLIYGFILLVFGLLSAWFITKKLMKPIKDLSVYLFYLREQIDKNPSLQNLDRPIPESINKLVAINMSHPDEWSELIKSFELFLTSVKVYSENSSLRASLLTHELKTPLTVIQNSIEQLSPFIVEDLKAKAATLKINDELKHLTKLINDFLSWSLIVSQLHSEKDLYALHLQDEVKNIVNKLNSSNHQRIQLQVLSEKSGDDTVFALPLHLQMLISNLISNALKYSPEDKNVLVSINALELTIKDFGSGLSTKVIERLGIPFNVDYSQKRGSGLGLAFVSIIVKKYGWQWKVDSNESGTTMTIIFYNDESNLESENTEI